MHVQEFCRVISMAGSAGVKHKSKVEQGLACVMAAAVACKLSWLIPYVHHHR
jgi:hypothetical protein